MFDSKKKTVFIYLSEKGCLGYVIHQAQRYDKALLVVSPKQKHPFANATVSFEASNKMSKLLYQSFGAFNRAGLLLDELVKKHKEIQLYFPAFHPWNFIFLKVAQQRGISSYLTIHDYITHKGEKSRLTERIQKACISRATKTVFLSEHVRQQAVDDLGHSEHFIVDPHPILSAGIKNKLPHSKLPRILFLGRVVEYKGVQHLMNAINDLNIEKLTIAGQQKKKVRTKNKKIHFVDKYLSEKEMGQLLKEHHILVLPYLNASQSGILTLGIDAGMAMVISKVGGLQEQLPRDAAIWCDPSVLSIKKAIQKLMDDPDLYGQLKEKVELYRCECEAD